MLRHFLWKSLFGVYIICLTEVQCRVGYSSKNSNNPSTLVCNGTDGVEYTCTYGHCCEDDTCCSHYYELWWFWLIWGLIFLIGCCCFYQHRQKHLANRSRRRRRRRHKDLYEGVCNYPGPPLENSIMGTCKLPIYSDVVRMPPTSSPPPPYSARRRPIHTIACLQPNDKGETSMSIIHCNITSSMLSLASLSHYIPELLAKNAISPLTSMHSQQLESIDNNNNPSGVIDGTPPKITLHKDIDVETGVKPDFLLPPKPETSTEIHIEKLVKESPGRWSCSSDEMFEVNNNNPAKNFKFLEPPDACDDDDDYLPRYESATYPLLTNNDDQSTSLGNGRNGDVILNLSP